MLKAILIAAACLLAASTAYAGPYGYRLGGYYRASMGVPHLARPAGVGSHQILLKPGPIVVRRTNPYTGERVVKKAPSNRP